jgi:type III pantothenate kinase
MLLLIDAGNTKIKWAVFHLPLTSAQLSAAHAIGEVTQTERLQLLAQIQTFPITRILYSNVAGVQVEQDILAQFAQLSSAPQQISAFKSQAQCAGLTNLYTQATQLGSDRFASAIAAHHLFPNRNLIVATCGTATTVDYVNTQAQFAGGMILPGLPMMAQSLARNTAQLPEVLPKTKLNRLFALSTEQAILSGCIHAQVGAMGLAMDSIRQNPEQALCVISGGAAPYLLAQLNFSYHYVENLVLTGLLCVAKSSSDL